jgi:hypothetical protein
LKTYKYIVPRDFASTIHLRHGVSTEIRSAKIMWAINTPNCKNLMFLFEVLLPKEDFIALQSLSDHCQQMAEGGVQLRG